MEGLEKEFVQLELKYCERCGALWLRPSGSEVIYCGGCAKAIVELPGFGSVEGAVEVPGLPTGVADSAFWAEGGNA